VEKKTQDGAFKLPLTVNKVNRISMSKKSKYQVESGNSGEILHSCQTRQEAQAFCDSVNDDYLYIRCMDKKELAKLRSAALQEILARFDNDREIVAFREFQQQDLNSDDLMMGRLERSALNQVVNNEPTMFTRYAIWAETVRGSLLFTEENLRGQIPEENIRRLKRCVNSLAPFSEIQRLFSHIDAPARALWNRNTLDGN
jgi:hypothetical protein